MWQNIKPDQGFGQINPLLTLKKKKKKRDGGAFGMSNTPNDIE